MPMESATPAQSPASPAHPRQQHHAPHAPPLAHSPHKLHASAWMDMYRVQQLSLPAPNSHVTKVV